MLAKKTMTKIVALAVLALGLSGCAVAGIGVAAVGAGISIASTAVDVTTGVAKGAVHTVAGSSDEKPKD